MILEIPEATPSNNTVMRVHFRKRSAEHKRWNWLVKEATNGHRIKAQDICIVTVKRYGSRLLDWDNMAGGLKYLMDALIHNNLIIDDNPQCVTRLHMFQHKCSRKEEKTIVEIE